MSDSDVDGPYKAYNFPNFQIYELVGTFVCIKDKLCITLTNNIASNSCNNDLTQPDHYCMNSTFMDNMI